MSEHEGAARAEAERRHPDPSGRAPVSQVVVRSGMRTGFTEGAAWQRDQYAARIYESGALDMARAAGAEVTDPVDVLVRAYGGLSARWSVMTERAAEHLARAVRAEARIAELEADRDEWRRLFSDCHPIHLDGVLRTERAEAAIERVRALHASDPVLMAAESGRAVRCRGCGGHWPCPTIRALDADTTEGMDDESR